MSNTLIATLAGLWAAITWGASDWLLPRSKHQLSVWQINFAVNGTGFVVALVVIALTSLHFPAAEQTLRAILASAVICSGYIVFIKALTIGAVGIVVPLSSIYPMVTLALSVVFLHQVYALLQVVAMAIIIAGAALLSYEKNHEKLPLHVLHRASLLTIAAALIWGVGFFLLNPLVGKVQWQMLYISLDATGTLMAALLLLVIYRGRIAKPVRAAAANPSAFNSGLLLGIGTAALYAGANRVGNIIIPAVLSSLSPLIAAALGAVVDKEKLGVLKRLGAVIAVGGIVLLNIH